MNIIPILVQFVGHDEDNGGVLNDIGELMEDRKWGWSCRRSH
jgi:hypothetical protein